MQVELQNVRNELTKQVLSGNAIDRLQVRKPPTWTLNRPAGRLRALSEYPQLGVFTEAGFLLGQTSIQVHGRVSMV